MSNAKGFLLRTVPLQCFVSLPRPAKPVQFPEDFPSDFRRFRQLAVYCKVTTKPCVGVVYYGSKDAAKGVLRFYCGSLSPKPLS